MLEWTAVFPGGEELCARVIGAERDWPSIWVEGFALDEYAWVTGEHLVWQSCPRDLITLRFDQADKKLSLNAARAARDKALSALLV